MRSSTPDCIGRRRSLPLDGLARPAPAEENPRLRQQGILLGLRNGTATGALVGMGVAAPHSFICFRNWAEIGSPPRVWGTLGSAAVDLDIRRFTPTCVGNTQRTLISVLAISVHPHVCGEHENRGGNLSGSAGSPPRVWGTPHHRRRSLPAPTVHPHVCGEHIETAVTTYLRSGSPPRVWGTPLHSAPFIGTLWFTPTCVGNTSLVVSLHALPSVHPHVCGEHFSVPVPEKAIDGSPPRVWGTH